MSRLPYDTFRETLATRYPDYGYALWAPNPGGLYNAVEVGDVGFIREGYFHRLFNTLLPENDPSNQRIGVPENYQPLCPRLSNHIRREVDGTEDFYSKHVSLVSRENIARVGPDDLEEIKFCSPGKRGAMLSLPFPAQREDTVARVDFKSWIVKHIDRWVAFAESHGFEINGMQDIILVTGRHCAKSWINVAFSDSLRNAEVSIGVRTTGVSNVDLERRSVHGDVVVKLGPRGHDLPEDQCIFIRGFRVVRIVKKWPRVVGQAGPHEPEPGPELEPEPEVEAIGDSADLNVTNFSDNVPTFFDDLKFQDPLHVLLQYITEMAPDCDMAIVHDDNLACIGSNPLDSPKQSALIGHLRGSALPIRQVQYNSSSSNGNSGGVVAAEIATPSKEESPPVNMLSNTLITEEQIHLEHLYNQILVGPSGHTTRSSHPTSFSQWMRGLDDQYEQAVVDEAPWWPNVLDNCAPNFWAQPLQQGTGFSSVQWGGEVQLGGYDATTTLPHDAMSFDGPSEQDMLSILLQDVQQDPRPGSVLDPKQKTCDRCFKYFSTHHGLRRHVKDKHEPRRRCPFCDFTWTRPGKIKTHILTHHDNQLSGEEIIELRNLRGWHPTTRFIARWVTPTL